MGYNDIIKLGFEVHSKDAEKSFDTLEKKIQRVIVATKMVELNSAASNVAKLTNSVKLLGSASERAFNAMQKHGMDQIFGDAIKKSKQQVDIRKKMAKVEMNVARSIKASNKAAVASLFTTNKMLKKQEGWWAKSKKGVLGFNGSLLSIMFLGMQMKKTFTAALSSIFEGYKKIIPENHIFNQKMTTLNANWEYFKYQMADAMVSSGVFNVLIDGAIGFVRALQKLPDWAKWSLVAVTAIGVIIGAFLLLAGVVGLGVAGLVDLGEALGIIGGSSVGIGLLSTNIGKIFKYTWEDLGASIANVSKKFGNWITSINAKTITDILKGLGTKVKAFANTVVGSGIIIGAALYGAFKLSEYGVELLGKKYTSTINAMKGTALDAAIGIAGTFGLVIPGAIEAVFEWALKAAYHYGAGMVDALIAGFKGESMVDAFKKQWDSFDMRSILDRNITKPVIALGNAGVTIKEELGWITDVKDSTHKNNVDSANNKNEINNYQTIILNAQDALANGTIDQNTYNTLAELAGPNV